MLEHFLVSEVFTFMLIFCRIGGGIMLLPGFGESYVSVSVRLTFALLISLLLMPLLSKSLPSMPASPISLTLMLGTEIIIGVLIGAICNLLIATAHIAGSILSTQIGLSSAVIFDVAQNTQGTALGNFISLLTILLLFSTDLHYLMLEGITQSYSIFLPGHFLPLHDFVEVFTRMVGTAFSVAVQISAPLIVAIVLLFLGGGILSRLSPTMQVFFIITPAQLLLGMFIFMTSISAMMLYYLETYRDSLSSFLAYVK